MKLQTHLAYWTGIAILAIMIILQQKCNRVKCPDVKCPDINYIYKDTGTHHIDTIHTTVIDSIEVSYPIPAITDTADILKKYFSKRVYRRSFEDSLIKANWTDIVQENKLQNIKSNLTYSLKKPVALIMPNPENPLPELRNKIFGGIGIGYEDGFKTNLSIFVLSKKDNGYSFSNNLIGKQPNATVTFYRKISFRKVK